MIRNCKQSDVITRTDVFPNEFMYLFIIFSLKIVVIIWGHSIKYHKNDTVINKMKLKLYNLAVTLSWHKLLMKNLTLTKFDVKNPYKEN